MTNRRLTDEELTRATGCRKAANYMYRCDMHTMNVNLSDGLVEFVAEQMREAGYTNQSEVVCDGLRLLRMRQEKRRALVAALGAGITAKAAGRVKLLTGELMRDIAARGRRLAAKRSEESRS